MTEPRQYNLRDFVAEHQFEAKSIIRFQKIANMAVQRQKETRKKMEELKRLHADNIRGLEAQHLAELEAAKREAFEQGRQQGLKEGHESVDNALITLETSSQKLLESERDFLRKAERQIVLLALAAAEKIVGREVTADSEIVIFTVTEALKEIADKVKITIHLNPREMENVMSHRRELMDVHHDIAELEFEADERIKPGGCLIETLVGAVDGRLSSQIEEIERRFTQGNR